jgi:hypothetical protein
MCAPPVKKIVKRLPKPIRRVLPKVVKPKKPAPKPAPAPEKKVAAGASTPLYSEEQSNPNNASNVKKRRRMGKNQFKIPKKDSGAVGGVGSGAGVNVPK